MGLDRPEVAALVVGREAAIDGSQAVRRLVIDAMSLRRGATIETARCVEFISSTPRRGATIEGSRGFQPTEIGDHWATRRGATVESSPCETSFKRRYATHGVWRTGNRGLKPTATIARSLRDQDKTLADQQQRHHVSGTAHDSASVAERHLPIARRFNAGFAAKVHFPRRGATPELADLNQEAAGLAGKIQRNFEELGI